MKNMPTLSKQIALLLCCMLILAGCTSTKAKDMQAKQVEPGLSDFFGGTEDADEPVPVTAPDPDPAPKTAVTRVVAPTEYEPKEITYTTEDFEDLWDRIRAGYALPTIESRHIAEYERWYSSRPEYIERVVNRATPFLYYITTQVENRDMPLEIALLPAIESAYKTNALSSAKAVGLWQFIPATGRHYGLKQNWWYDGRKDIVASTQSALNYLEKLNKDFDGDWALTLASYNAGEGTVSRSILANQKAGKPTNYTSLPLRSETRRYVPKLIAFSNIIKTPEKYGLKIAKIPNKPYFSVIHLSSQIDFEVIAEAAEVPIKELEMLNPGFKRWETDPKGPHRLLVKASALEKVTDVIASTPQHKRVLWAHYKVTKGDHLGRIAQQHGISVAAIKKANNLRTSLIRAGQDLYIPVSRNYQAGKSANKKISSNERKSSISGSSSSKQTPKVISVNKGDTLWSLSRQYKVTLNELTQWNKISPNDMILSGQKLKIWRY